MDKFFIYLPLGFVGIIALVFGAAYLAYDDSNDDSNDIDVMSPDNLCRPTSSNERICGMGITNSSNVHVILGNGEYLITDCLRDEYPRGNNGTHYFCSDEVYKTVEYLKELSNDV